MTGERVGRGLGTAVGLKVKDGRWVGRLVGVTVGLKVTVGELVVGVIVGVAGLVRNAAAYPPTNDWVVQCGVMGCGGVGFSAVQCSVMASRCAGVW